MLGFLRNFRGGFALACGLAVSRSDFRPGLGQAAGLGVAVALLVVVLRQMTASMPQTTQATGPGPYVLLIVGVLGSVYVVRWIQTARISLIALLTLILSAEIWVLLIGAAAWRLVTKFPSPLADQVLPFLPWLILAWMILIVLRSAKALAARDGS